MDLKTSSTRRILVSWKRAPDRPDTAELAPDRPGMERVQKGWVDLFRDGRRCSMTSHPACNCLFLDLVSVCSRFYFI